MLGADPYPCPPHADVISHPISLLGKACMSRDTRRAPPRRGTIRSHRPRKLRKPRAHTLGSTRVDPAASRKRHGGDRNPRRQGPGLDVSRRQRECSHLGGSRCRKVLRVVTIHVSSDAVGGTSANVSVQSVRLTCRDPRSDPVRGPSEVDLRRSRNSAAPAGPTSVELQRLAQYPADQHLSARPRVQITGVSAPMR